jgi:hypothetical protein
MMLYARKIHYDFFMNIFYAELYFCDKFRVKCFQLMKIQQQQQQQQLSLLSQASWGRLEMKPTESKNKKHKKGTS